ASDVEVVDDYPSHVSAYSRRRHRWVRGDWQILRWLFPRVPDSTGRSVSNPLKMISRWKILDNLRRSLLEISTIVLLMAAWLVLPGSPGYWTAAVCAVFVLPSYFQAFVSLMSLPFSSHPLVHLREAGKAFVIEQINVLLFLAFILYQALASFDAISRTIFRLSVTRRKLLEWETAAQAEANSQRRAPVDLYLHVTPIVSLAIAIPIAVLRPTALYAAAPMLALWFFSRSFAR